MSSSFFAILASVRELRVNGRQQSPVCAMSQLMCCLAIGLFTGAICLGQSFAAPNEPATRHDAAQTDNLGPRTKPSDLSEAAEQPDSTDAEKDKKDTKEAADSNSDKDDATKEKCDDEKREALKKAVAGAYKGVFYDNDFSYVLDECYQDWQLGDMLKRQLNRCDGFLDLGGQYRFRLQDERNIRGLGLTGLDDSFLQHRTRLFANWQLSSKFRVFAEFRDALSTNEQFAPRLIEESRADMQNLFLDAVLYDDDPGKLTLRSGRQELLFGDERMISPLDWANTRRSFEGLNVLWHTKKYALNGFWVRPLNALPSPFSSPNPDQQLYGMYSTYTANNSNILDTFCLAFENTENGLRVNSIGGRFLDNHGDWLFELWGNVQFGTNIDDTSHTAGAWTVGFGRHLPGPWSPTLWVYYDWASGGRDLGATQGHFQFFPLAHKYLGFMDLFARSNIESPNLLLTFSPTEKLQILIWYYYLFLETTSDTPYNVTMTPFARTVAPGAADLGHEIDLLATYKLGPRGTLVGGYSRFFSGDYYDTPGLPFSGNADFFYLHYQVNF